MEYIQCRVTIQGTAALSQSHQHNEDWLDGETPDNYDKRTWRSKMNTDAEGYMFIPAMALQRSLIEGAKFSKKQIEGHGRSTWTKRFEAGVTVMDNARVLRRVIDDHGNEKWEPIHRDSVTSITISANPDGVRGSGKRVPKRLPQIPPPWRATFEIIILDPMITQDIFEEMLEYTGVFVGVGQFRPEKGGNNGRFVMIDDIEWHDNRLKVQKRKAA